MKKILLLSMILCACNNSQRPPHSYLFYDSLAIQLVHEQDSVVRMLVDQGKTSEAADMATLYKRQRDSLRTERDKYYPKGVPQSEVDQLKKNEQDSIKRIYRKY
jgi:hypothetical protein